MGREWKSHFLPVRIFLCDTLAEWRATVAPHTIPDPTAEGSTTTIVGCDGGDRIVLFFDPEKLASAANGDLAGLFVHEAVHVLQAAETACAGADATDGRPLGSEGQAYFVQCLVSWMLAVSALITEDRR